MTDDSIPSLIKKLSKSLMDPLLLKRFGDNLNSSMSLDYEKYLIKRYKELNQEFIKINKNVEDGITIDELTEFLNSYGIEVSCS
jgi:hypothetical protein